MAQKKLSWMNLPFGPASKHNDTNGWSKHDAKLLAAVKKGDINKVNSLLKKGTVDPTKIEPSEGISSLHAAAASGRLDILNVFLTSELNIETTDATGKTALHHAADKGRVDVTKRLLAAGANVSAVDDNQLSALHHACSSGMIGCLLELLSMPHSPVNARDKDGRSPLSYAAWRGQASLCKLLLKKGAAINNKDSNGRTPLILAGMNGSAELCSFLIAQGADLSITDNDGYDALWHCTNSKRGVQMSAARVIQEAMTGSGRSAAKDIPSRTHSEREIAERSTPSDLYESTDNEEPKENLYEGINEKEYSPDYSDEDTPSSASAAAAAAASATDPWQGATYGNESAHITRMDTYAMPSDAQQRSQEETIYSDVICNEPQADEYGELETLEDHENLLKTDDLLEGWRQKLMNYEDELRSDSEEEGSDVNDPSQLLLTFPQEMTDSDAGGRISTTNQPPPPLSPAETFFDNLMATIVQRDKPPLAQGSDGSLLPFDMETMPAVEQLHGSDRSSTDDGANRENIPSLTESSDPKNEDAYQLTMQELEETYHSQLEDLERKMAETRQNSHTMTQQLELSKEQAMQVNKDRENMKHRLESAIGIKNWLHNELKALYDNIEVSENKLMQAGRQERDKDKDNEFDMLSDLEGFKQHIDYMLETSNVEDHHSIDLDASAQKTNLKMMEIKLDRLVKENAELRARVKGEQQRKADERSEELEKRMAHEYKKLDEEIEFRDADEMISYVKDSIIEISRLREQNAAMTARLQRLDDLGLADEQNLVSELERTRALNKNLMDKIIILQRNIEEQSEAIRERGKNLSELGEMVESFGEVAVQRDIFIKENNNLKQLLQKKMTESRMSDEELRGLDEMRNKQKELLMIVARMEEADQRKESELHVKTKHIVDIEKQLEEYGRMASERDILRRELDAMSTMKAQFDVNSEELNEMRRINIDLSETKKELLETIERRDFVCDEKEKQISELNRQLQDFGKLASEKDHIQRELESLRSVVGEHQTVIALTASESYSVPNEKSVSGQEYEKMKQAVGKLKEDIEKKNEELWKSEERYNEVNKLILLHKSAEDEKLKRIEELSEKIRELELILDVKKEEYKTEIRIVKAEHRNELEMLSHKNEVLKHDLEEARERVGDLENLKVDIHWYEDTLCKKNKEVEQLSEKIAYLEKEAVNRSALDDDNDRIREEHRMMAREIVELKLALESSHMGHVLKDYDKNDVKPVKSALLTASPLPTTNAIEEIKRLTTENAQLQKRVVDLEKAFLKRISTDTSVEHDDRLDDLDKSDIVGRHERLPVMDDKDLQKSWQQLEKLSTTSQTCAASPKDEAAVRLSKSGFEIRTNAPFETWNNVLEENRALKVEAENALKKMEAELADAELRNAALKENNRELLQEVRGLRKTVDEQSRHLSEISRTGWIPVHGSTSWSQKESSDTEHSVSLSLQMAPVKTAEDTLEKWKEMERLERENSELRKEIEDRRIRDRLGDYQVPKDGVQSSKISELVSENMDLIAVNDKLLSEVKELRTIVEIYRSEKFEEESTHSTSEESDREELHKPIPKEMSGMKMEILHDGKETEKQIENYGKLAVERDILMNEVNALKKLLKNQTTTEKCHEKMESESYKANDKENEIKEMKEKMSNYGQLATEKDILANEVRRLKKLLGNIDLGKIAVERDILTNENKTLKKLLEDLKSSERPVEQMRVHANAAEKSDDDSDNEQRRIDDYGKLAVERDILADEVQYLKKILEEMKASEKAVKHIHYEATKTEKRSEVSDDSDDEKKTERDIGKIAVERDILANENKTLKKLLEDLKSSERPVEQMRVHANAAEKSDDDSDYEQRQIDDYGKLAVERDILADEVQYLKKLLEEMKASEKAVKHIHYEATKTEKRSEVSDDSDDEKKTERDIRKIAVERDILTNENKILKKLLEDLKSSKKPVEQMREVDVAVKNSELEELKKKMVDFGEVVTERDVLRKELAALKLILDSRAPQTGMNIACETKRASVPIFGAVKASEKSQEPYDLNRRLLQIEEANHRLERKVSEMQEIADKQSAIIKRKEKLIHSFNEKEKKMSDMEMRIDELKNINLRLSQKVAEQEEIAEKQSEIIKKKDRRISEMNIFAQGYDKFAKEKDALCKEVEDLKLLLERQKDIRPGNVHLEFELCKDVASSKPSLESKCVAENDLTALLAKLEESRRDREELLTEISSLEETLQDQDQTIEELQRKEHEHEKVLAEVNTLKKELDIARGQLSSKQRSTDFVDFGKKDVPMLKSQPDLMTGSPLSSDDEGDQDALNALRRKIAEKESMIQRMDSMDEEKQFLQEEVAEMRAKLKRQETMMDNILTPVSTDDDLTAEVKHLRQEVEYREREMEEMRIAGLNERRELQNQIERLQEALKAHPSHLNVDYEASLLTTIAALEESKMKLQSLIHEKEAQNDQEIKELVSANDELMTRLKDVKNDAQRQYSELLYAQEEVLEREILLQKQCAELVDEQEELLEKDRLLQIEVIKLKEELQETESKLLKEKTKLYDENKNLLEQMEHQKLSFTRETIDLQKHIAVLTANVQAAEKDREDAAIIQRHLEDFRNTVVNQADEISKKDKEIAELANKLKHHGELLAEKDVLSEKVERLEDLLHRKDEPTEKVEEQLVLGLGCPVVDTQPPEIIPDLREIVEAQRQTLTDYEKRLHEQGEQMKDFGKLSVENDILLKELKILRDLAGKGDNKESSIDEAHGKSTTVSDDEKVADSKLTVKRLTKENKELREKIDELEFSQGEEREKSEKKILQLKWELTKSEDENNRWETENKELCKKIEDLERTLLKKTSDMAHSGREDDEINRKEENEKLRNEILELRLELTRSEELRSQRHLTSDKRHVHLETMVEQLESENSKLKLKVGQLEAEVELLKKMPETEEKIKDSQQQMFFSNAPENDNSYVRQLEGDVELLREANRALSRDIADLQYRLTDKLLLLRSSGIPDGDSDRDYLHKKMKDFTQQSLKYLAEIQDLEEKNLRARQELKAVRQENAQLRDEVDTLQDICQLHNTSPKELVNRLRFENSKLQQFIKILEERLCVKASARSSEPQIDVKSISAESFGMSKRHSEELSTDEGASLGSSQHLLFAGTLDECHKEIRRLRQINKDLERKYREIVSTYRSHLLASIQGRLDPEVKEALIRILRMKPDEYNVR